MNMEKTIVVVANPETVTEGDIAPETPSKYGANKTIKETKYNNGVPVSERFKVWGFNNEGNWTLLEDTERCISLPPYSMQDAMDLRETLVAMGYPYGAIMEVCKGKVLEVRSRG